MEINSQNMETLLQIQSQHAEYTVQQQTNRQEKNFDAILAKALNNGDQSQNVVAGTPLPPGAGSAEMISKMLLDADWQGQNQGSEDELLQFAFNQASGTLDLWDVYAKTLGSADQNANLREAYALLEGIDSRVTMLKRNTAGLRSKNSELDALLNDLDAMTVTEKFKFNRGDYA